MYLRIADRRVVARRLPQIRVDVVNPNVVHHAAADVVRVAAVDNQHRNAVANLIQQACTQKTQAVPYVCTTFARARKNTVATFSKPNRNGYPRLEWQDDLLCVYMPCIGDTHKGGHWRTLYFCTTLMVCVMDLSICAQ